MSSLEPSAGRDEILVHGAVRLPVPARWERLEGPEDTIVLRYPHTPGVPFHPTIAVRSLPTSGSLPALAAQGVAGVIGGLRGARLLSHDRGEINGHPARGQVYALDVGGHTVVADRWLALVGGHAVELTLQCMVEQLEDMQPMWSAVLGDTVLVAPIDSGEPMPEPLREPPRDNFLQHRSGLDVESIDRVGAAQPYCPVGPVLSDEAFKLVIGHAGTPRMGIMQAAALADHAAELVAAGLMEPDGTFAVGFEVLGIALAQSRQRLRVEGVHGATSTQFDAWIGGGSVTVASRASQGQLIHGSSQRPVPSDHVQVDVLCEGSLPLAVAAWSGLGPAWTVLSEIDRMPAELFEQRLVQGEKVPAPQGADDALLRMWRQPWFAWRLVMPDLDREMAWLNAGAAGQYRLGRQSDGTMLVRAEPAGYVWNTLVREIGILCHVR